MHKLPRAKTNLYWLAFEISRSLLSSVRDKCEDEPTTRSATGPVGLSAKWEAGRGGPSRRDGDTSLDKDNVGKGNINKTRYSLLFVVIVHCLYSTTVIQRKFPIYALYLYFNFSMTATYSNFPLKGFLGKFTLHQ
jgi:hypothetical protein